MGTDHGGIACRGGVKWAFEHDHGGEGPAAVVVNRGPGPAVAGNFAAVRRNGLAKRGLGGEGGKRSHQLRQDLSGPGELLRSGVGVAQAQGVVAFEVVDVAGVEEDAAFEGVAEEPPQSDGFVEGEPDVEAAAGRVPMGASGEEAVDGLQRAVAASAQFGAQALEVLFVHAAGEESGEDPLAEGAGTVVHLHFDVGEALHDAFVGDGPSDAQSGRERFGRAAEGDDHAVFVVVLERFGGVAFVDEVLVGAVLDDGEPVRGAGFDEGAPAFVGHDDAGGVVVGGDGVEDGVLRACGRLVERVGADAVRVHGDAVESHAGGLEELERFDVAGRFGVDGGSGGEEADGDHLERLEGAGGDEDLRGGAADVPCFAHVVCDGFAQHAEAFGRQVAERVDAGGGFGGDDAPHVAREEARVEFAGAESGHARFEFVAVDGLDGGVVGAEESGGEVVGPVWRAGQHERPGVADDARAGAASSFDDAVVGEFLYGGDDGGAVDAEAFGEGALAGQARADGPCAGGDARAHVGDDLVGEGRGRGALRRPVNVQWGAARHGVLCSVRWRTVRFGWFLLWCIGWLPSVASVL